MYYNEEDNDYGSSYKKNYKSDEEVKAKFEWAKKNPYYPFYLICYGFPLINYYDEDRFGYCCILNPNEWNHDWSKAVSISTQNDTAPSTENAFYEVYLDMTNKFSVDEIIMYANKAADNIIVERFYTPKYHEPGVNYVDIYSAVINSKEPGFREELLEIDLLFNMLQDYTGWQKDLKI